VFDISALAAPQQVFGVTAKEADRVFPSRIPDRSLQQADACSDTEDSYTYLRR
jgi:hypothetical protein